MYKPFRILIASELLEFGGISNESLYEGEFTNTVDKDAMDTNHFTSDAENMKTEKDVSFTPAGSQFGEIGERIRSAKAGARERQRPPNPIIMPIDNHI